MQGPPWALTHFSDFEFLLLRTRSHTHTLTSPCFSARVHTASHTPLLWTCRSFQHECTSSSAAWPKGHEDAQWSLPLWNPAALMLCSFTSHQQKGTHLYWSPAVRQLFSVCGLITSHNSIFRCGRPHFTNKEVGSEWESWLPVVTAIKWHKEGFILACVQSSDPLCCLLRSSGLAMEWNTSPCALSDSPCDHSAWHWTCSPADRYLSTDWAASSSLGDI